MDVSPADAEAPTAQVLTGLADDSKGRDAPEPLPRRLVAGGLNARGDRKWMRFATGNRTICLLRWCSGRWPMSSVKCPTTFGR